MKTRGDKRGWFERLRRKKFARLRHLGLMDEYQRNKNKIIPLIVDTKKETVKVPLLIVKDKWYQKAWYYIIKLFRKIWRR